MEVLLQQLKRIGTKLLSLPKVIFVLLLLNSGLILAQGEANMWYFGRKAGLDFNTTPPTMLINGSQNNGDVDEGHATISDAAGNLLFYTNGLTIWDRNHAVMNNGTGLLGDWSATQCATIFPVPGFTNRYYVITTPLTGSTNQVRYNIVDLNPATNGGFATGSVTTKNVAMPGGNTYMMEALVSCPHFNGTDIWVVGHGADNPGVAGTDNGNRFYVWRVTSGGIVLDNSYALGYDYPSNPVGPSSRGIGIMKFNSCFNRLFISFYNGTSQVQGFQFSNTSGVVSAWPAPISAPLTLTQFRNSGGTLAAMDFAYGIEISPNGRYLYVTLSGEGAPGREIQQFDLQAAGGTNAAIQGSAVRLTPASPDGVRYGQLQLGPDGRIYHTLHQWNAIGAGGYCKVSVINAPNSAGAGSNYVEGAYTWPVSATNVGSTMGLPSFHKGFIAGTVLIRPTGTVTALDQVCVGEPVDMEANYTQAGTNWRWNIDANVGPNTTIEYTTQNITHTYGTAGTYTVTLLLDDATCGYTVTENATVIVSPVINTAGSVTCGPPRGNVTSPNGAYTYVWYADAAMTKPITTGTTNVSLPVAGSGTVYLRAESSATPSSGSGTVLGPANTPNGWASPGAGNIIPFTLNSAVTINSFQWASGIITYCCTDNRVYNVQIQDGAGVNIFYNQNRTVDVFNTIKTTTESPALALAPGNYRIVITGPSNPNQWASLVPLSQANNALVITGGAGLIGNLNYNYTNYTIANIACSKTATINYNCPLPVSWLYFQGRRADGHNVLTWATGSEKDNAYFEILRSLDGVNYEVIATRPGAIHSQSVQVYHYEDAFGGSEGVYYQIRQVDLNGASSLSPMVHIQGQFGVLQAALYPNPSQGIVTVDVAGSSDVQLEFINALGVVVHSQSVSDAETISLKHLSKGVYSVVFRKDYQQNITKLVIE